MNKKTSNFILIITMLFVFMQFLSFQSGKTSFETFVAFMLVMIYPPIVKIVIKK